MVQIGRKLINNPLTILAIIIVKSYKYFISPFFQFNCRFFPTCSDYSIESFKKFGFIKGSLLTFKRLIKCHPMGGQGYDPVEKMNRIEIKKVSQRFIKRFRQKYLYSNLPSKFSNYDEDFKETTIHLVLFENEKVISGLTLIEKKFLKNNFSLQLRGMFTISNHGSKGYGSKLICYVKEKNFNSKNIFLWCNAREEALNFYKKNGFLEFGEFFSIPRIGKHKKLYFKL